MAGAYPTTFVEEGYRIARDFRPDLPLRLLAVPGKAAARNLSPDPDDYKLDWPGHQLGEVYLPPVEGARDVGGWAGGASPFVTMDAGGAAPLIAFHGRDETLAEWADITAMAGPPEAEGVAQYRVADGRNVPGGTPGVMVAGSESAGQEAVFFPLHQLVAHHRGKGPPQFSTPVFDITADGGLNHLVAGGLHSLLRVEQQPGGGPLSLDAVCVPAWNLTRSAGDATGFGACYGKASIEPGPFLKQDNDQRTVVQAANAWAGVPALCAGMAAEEAGGVLSFGHVVDKHRLGVNAQGVPWNSMHLSLRGAWYWDQQRDAPPEFKRELHPACQNLAVPVHVELRYDPGAKHDWLGKRLPGLMRWHTTSALRGPKPPEVTTVPIKWKEKLDLGGPPVNPGPGQGSGKVPDPDPGDPTWQDFLRELGEQLRRWGGAGGGAEADDEERRAGAEADAELAKQQGKSAGDPNNPAGGQGDPGIDYEAIWKGVETAGRWADGLQLMYVGADAQLDPARTPYETGGPGLWGTAVRHATLERYDGRFGGAPVDAGPNLDSPLFPNVNRKLSARGVQERVAAWRGQEAAAGHLRLPPNKPRMWTEAALVWHGQSWGSTGSPTLAAGARYLSATTPGGLWFTPPEVVIDAPAPSTTSLTTLSLYNGLFGTAAVGTAAKLGFLTPNQTTGGVADGWYFTTSGTTGALIAELRHLDASAVARAGALHSFGHIKPGAADTYTLGDATLQWDQIFLDLGTAADPAVEFGSAGIYSGGTNQLNFSTADTLRARINATALAPAGSGTTLGALSDPWATVYGVDGNFSGKLTVGGLIDPTGLVLTEQASNPWTPAAGYGALYVKNTTPSSLRFVDDAGTDSEVMLRPDATLSLVSNTTDVGNVGAGEDDLMSYTVPAATLAANGDRLEFEAAFALAVATVRVKVHFGATVIYDSGSLVLAATAVLVVRGAVARTGAATQAAWATSTGALDAAAYSEPGETLSGTVAFKATGEATLNDDVVQKAFTVKYVPAP